MSTSQVLPPMEWPTRRQSAETCTEMWSEKSTEISTGNVQQADHCSTEAANWECNQKSTVMSNKKSTENLHKLPINSNWEVDLMVTKADFKRQLPSQAASTSQSHYRLQNTLYRSCRSTAQSSDSASILQLGKDNHHRGLFLLLPVHMARHSSSGIHLASEQEPFVFQLSFI